MPRLARYRRRSSRRRRQSDWTLGPPLRRRPKFVEGNHSSWKLRGFMAGKGFTVKKDWDNPREHAMPVETRVPAEVRLGTVLVAPATVLAPMAGVTDTVFRRFIRHASLFSTCGVAATCGGADAA